MNILVTGSAGFVGSNLIETFKNIRDKKDRTRNLVIDEIYTCDTDTAFDLLKEACMKSDIVFHFAGINRPKNDDEFVSGNVDLTASILEILSERDAPCPVVLSSSVQASLVGRYAGSPYGQSKKDAEELVLQYGERHHVPVYVCRFPNLFGKWCRPNYNSAVATFCYNIAHDLPITVTDPSIELELLYIDDLVAGMVDLCEGISTRCEYNGLEATVLPDGRYTLISPTHHATLGEIVELLKSFREQSSTFCMPEIPNGSFAKKLYSTYLSYLSPEQAIYPLKMNIDSRGSFTELIRTANCGQMSVNISLPGITKGKHWHNSKWELFIVVSGSGLIRQRDIRNSIISEYRVSGEKIEAVHMLPGYTHEIINLSDTENLVTMMWANESFDPKHPDTYFEEV